MSGYNPPLAAFITNSRWSQRKTWMQYRYYVAGAIFILLFLLGFLFPERTLVQRHLGVLNHSDEALSPREAAANSTLGFERLLAVSPKPSWRTRGLLAAANLTKLDFSIPPQPKNPDELVRAFEQMGSDTDAKRPHHGSAIAWMAHLDMLKFVIGSGFSTAFIVEDDVDWDVGLLDQMRLISDNVRNFTHTPKDNSLPFGHDWDVLWLGHCGDIIEKDKAKSLVYRDETRCKTELYSGWSKRFLQEDLPEAHRIVQRSISTVCTFGYGVTAGGAQKILTLLARGADEAFDVSMSSHCRAGRLRCITVNPQVMNHYEPPGGSGYKSPVHVGDGQGATVGETEFEHSKGTTGNIMNSTRCKVLFNDVCMRPPSEIR